MSELNLGKGLVITNELGTFRITSNGVYIEGNNGHLSSHATKSIESLKINGEEILSTESKIPWTKINYSEGVQAQMHEGETVLSNFEPEVIVPLSYIEKLIRENTELKLKANKVSYNKESDIKSLKIGNEIMLTEDAKVEWDKVEPKQHTTKISYTCNCKNDISSMADIIMTRLKNKGTN